jgi:hypothetical protein
MKDKNKKTAPSVTPGRGSPSIPPGRDSGTGSGEKLRRQAEEAALGKAVPSPASVKPMSAGEARQVLHELEVHRIELEMQN